MTHLSFWEALYINQWREDKQVGTLFHPFTYLQYLWPALVVKGVCYGLSAGLSKGGAVVSVSSSLVLSHAQLFSPSAPHLVWCAFVAISWFENLRPCQDILRFLPKKVRLLKVRVSALNQLSGAIEWIFWFFPWDDWQAWDTDCGRKKICAKHIVETNAFKRVQEGQNASLFAH